MNRFVFGLIFACFILIEPVGAEWAHRAGERDPFKGGSPHSAGYFKLDLSTPEAFWFQCHTARNLRLIWDTGRNVGNSNPNLEHHITVRIALVVDGAAPMFIAGRPTRTDNGDLMIVSDDVIAVQRLVLAIAAAKREIAVAGEINGRLRFSEGLPIANASQSVQKLVAGCRLGSPSS